MNKDNPHPRIKHVAIAGNIGAGKTSLSTKLAKHYNWVVHYENATDNPYLKDFYTNMQRWSFNLQIYFLNSRFQQILDIHNGQETVVQDRTIYEDAFIFAPNLHEMGLMTTRDFDNYFSLFQIMSRQVNPPDLLIYLQADIATLVSHIHRRGREYEGNMSLDYLKRLNAKYEKWIQGYNEGPLLIVNVDNLDFEESAENLGTIINKVDSQLHGLF